MEAPTGIDRPSRRSNPNSRRGTWRDQIAAAKTKIYRGSPKEARQLLAANKLRRKLGEPTLTDEWAERLQQDPTSPMLDDEWCKELKKIGLTDHRRSTMLALVGSLISMTQEEIEIDRKVKERVGLRKQLAALEAIRDAHMGDG